MKSIQCDVSIIGGGSTGTGLARDLAMRGFQVVLVEKGDLSHGTTGRYHGLLHSGGRYAVKDPTAAKECIEENIILRKILPFCIEDTGGFFVLTPWDDPDYASQFVQGCRAAGIPIEEVPISRMLKAEPYLNKNISRCFQVPDGSADSFLASEANIYSARAFGAQVFTYHPVISFIKSSNQVKGVICLDLETNEEMHIHCSLVVNASGAWAGKIANLAGVQVQMLPGKGTMLALNHRIVQKVINRCKLPSDGDILVPIHDVAIFGTTDIPVKDPDHFGIDHWETRLIIEEGEKIIPGLRDMRFLRAWAGVRPLYRDNQPINDRDVSRAFVLLDHEKRDGLENFITITGGKWTTYRKMAEVTADLVSQKLQKPTKCRTHLEPLEHPYDRKNSKSFFTPGGKLSEIEKGRKYSELICECELVTKEEILLSIRSEKPKSLDDLRRETRIGMGPCQGGFCTLRVAGILHQETGEEITKINQAILDFLEERKKGILPVLWGKQLQQEWFDDLIFDSLLNVHQLTGVNSSPFRAEPYAPPGDQEANPPTEVQTLPNDPLQFPGQKFPSNRKRTNTFDVVVIGGGLAGLTAAWRLSNRGAKVCLVTKGRGALLWHAGCIDLLGRMPEGNRLPIDSPFDYIDQMDEHLPFHPYTFLGKDTIRQALDQFANLCNRYEYPLQGNGVDNWFLPASSGAVRPTAYAPSTMTAGDMRSANQTLILGFQGYLDFHPRFVSENLSLHGSPTRYDFVNLVQNQPRQGLSTSRLADLFDDKEFLQRVIQEVKRILKSPQYKGIERVGFPAVLGRKKPTQNMREMAEAIEKPVFEIPTLPPSIPGLRLHEILTSEIRKMKGKIVEGSRVTHSIIAGSKVEGFYAEAAARLNSFYSERFVLATGGILGGGFSKPFDRNIREDIFGLPVKLPSDPPNLGTVRQYQLAGIQVNRQFQPINLDSEVILENLWCVGTCLYQADPVATKSFEGISLATGFRMGEILA